MNPTTRLSRALISLRDRNSFTVTLAVAAMLTAAATGPHADAATPDEMAAQIIEATGVKGGLVVHVGCGDGKLTAAMRVNDRYQVQGLDRDPANVAAAREHIMAAGRYGDVYVDRMTTDALPYADNLINLLVVEDDAVTLAEIERVLAPLGKAYVHRNGKWKVVDKAWPNAIDEWTHYMHGPSNNAVAADTRVGPPRHLQWLGSPRWSRHHDRMASMSALVTTKGRMFYIMDEGSRVTIETPPRWMLTARDAFNGTILWKKPIAKWHSHMWPLKSGPSQLTRRLVAVGDRVYVTLGIDAPMTCLDAATGNVIATYEQTTATEEIVVEGGTAFALVREGKWELSDYVPQAGRVGDQAAVRKLYWNAKPREVVAIDVESGRELWRHRSTVAPMTLAADAYGAYFHDGRNTVVALDRATGKPAWSATGGAKDKFNFNFGPKLVLHEGVVLLAGGDRKMHAYDAMSGKELWNTPHERGGYQSPEDLLVIDGKVWSAALTSGRDDGEFTGRDVRTGEVKVKFPPNVSTYWFHHRCYIAKATDNFLIPSRTGIEFVDFRKKDWDIHHWVRGGCLYGVMPANGLTYAPPHNCACYPEAKLYGFNALAADNPSRRVDKPDPDRFERGPAYDALPGLADDTVEGDWPTYRGDIGRSAHARHNVPAKLAQAWATKLGGRLTSPVIAGGRVYIAQVDTHTLHALDAETGKPIWSFTAGGRIDSPPTVHKGTLLFGSADGYAYCLRASDGALAWRFRAAPKDMRLTAFEQVESVWPVHGNILIKDGAAYFVAGRSVFLDGGITMFKLDPTTGEVLAEQQLDDKDPDTGENLQARTQTLQGPAGLADILSSDGTYVYMRSQRFDQECKREGLGPVSGNAAAQGADQQGDGVHLYAPMGYLDQSYFHRAYWVYGKNFAGGHNGYYQAGKNAPAGRIICKDDTHVYGYGRKPEYLRWTTTIEHQLFAAPKDQPPLPSVTQADRRGSGYQLDAPVVQFANNPSVNPVGQALSVEAWVRADKPNGVIVSRGGPVSGYALVLIKGKPRFVIRVSDKNTVAAEANAKIGKVWTHLVGVLTKDKQVQLYVNGELAASAKAPSLLVAEPKQSMEIGADHGGAVGDDYDSPSALTGVIDDVRVYHGALTAADVSNHYNGAPATATDAKLVVHCDFDDGKANDASGLKNHGKAHDTEPVAGKAGRAMAFAGISKASGKPNRKKKKKPAGGYHVEHTWTADVPLYATAICIAGDTLLVAGPPDFVDENEAFARFREKQTQQRLAELDAALRGEQGGVLLAVDAKSGKTLASQKLPALPAWDGMAAAHGKLYVVTQDGTIRCLAGE